jgi:hypothetical protein
MEASQQRPIMLKRPHGSEWRLGHKPGDGTHHAERVGDASEDWEHYPADDAEENIGYQKLAWYAAPFGSTGVALLVMAVTVNGFKALTRGVIRLIMR